MMKYEMLGLFQGYLQDKFSERTAKTYLSKLETLLDGQSLLNATANFDMAKVIDNLTKIKYKNPFSQAKNALLLFCEFQGITISEAQLKEITLLEKRAKRKYRKLKPVDFKKVDSTIKRLKNLKLKLCYQTLLKTGLRVFEVAQITPDDCNISEDEIHFSFIGKGGRHEGATIAKSDDTLFFDRLAGLIRDTKESDKVFYSATYLQTKAKKYGFTCHDLRRIYAKSEYAKNGSKFHVMKKLRHSSMKSTKIYLRSKVKL